MNNNFRKLTKGYEAPNNDLYSGFNNNDLIVGGSGTGKTGGYVIPNLLNPYGNIIVSDTKGRLYKETKKSLEEKGYEVMLIDFMNPEQSMGYNPLDAIKGETGKEANHLDIMTVVNQIFPMSENQGRDDRFWIDSARSLTAFLIGFTLEAFPKEEHNMISVLEIFRCMGDGTGLRVIDDWLFLNHESYVSDMYRMISNVYKSERTWSCILQFAAEALEVFQYKEMKKIFEDEKNKFSIKDFLSKKAVLFINTSDSNRYADKIVNLLYSQLIHGLFLEASKEENGRLKTPVRLMIDDFASNVYIEDFDKIISVTRSRNIAVSILLQNMSQLAAMYGENKANSIIVNCDHILYLGGQDLKTAEYVGKRAGLTEDKVLLLPPEKAYLMKRGVKAMLHDKIVPYKELVEKNTDKLQMVGTLDSEDVSVEM